MLKRFFTVFLGSLAAIWFSIILFIGIIILAVIALIGTGNQVKIDKGSILCLQMYGEIPDRATGPNFEDIVMGIREADVTFEEILDALNIAKTDNDICGVYLDMQGASMGLAMRQELDEALKDFKKSGKWIVAYADNYNQGDYYTASVADDIYLNPSGQIAANGLGASVPFFKNALDKLGVEIQVIKVGTFKSAVEPFILNEMSDSARYQYDVMLGTVWNQYVNTVTDNLHGYNSSFGKVFKKMAATPMTAYTAQSLKEQSFVTALKYEYEVLKTLAKKSGKDDDEDPVLVSPREYLESFGGNALAKAIDDEDHIAVLYAVGDIVDSGTGGIAGDFYAPYIISLADNEKVKGLVLRVNSGGGSAFASEQIWASLEYFKKQGKPFVVSMGDVAASGGYYISCGADRIFADGATITGSIGIFGIIPYAQQLLNDKLGINFSYVETNPNAIFPRIDRPLTPDQHAALQKNIEDGYELFVSRVASGRDMTTAAVKRIAEGRVWAGETAKEIGLVDEIGGIARAIKYVAEKCDLDADNYTSYPKMKLTPLEMLLSASEVTELMKRTSASVSLGTTGLTPQQIRQANSILDRIQSMNYMQAKMEDLTLNL